MYTVPQLTDFSAPALEAEKKRLTDALEADAVAVKDEAALKAFRDRWMARKNGILTQVNDLWLKASPKEAKRDVGALVNEIRAHVEQRVEVIDVMAFSDSASVQVVKALDITLPGIRRPIGAEHPVLRTMNDAISVFRSMGYSVREGPEVETDYYNFEALNFPPNHPARDTQDTLTIADQESKPLRERLLLRTHTSPVQIRTMEQQKPPVRIICPGKVHRRDTPDASHSPVFHQVEGLAVDTNITFSDLKGTLDHAMKSLFGSTVKTRFFPSFFPFTEPSADVAISCIICGGKGCRTCKQTGWVELMGCGMVDPSVFDFVKDNGYDSTKISGFAFGMGVERLAMMKYGIDDIQMLFQGDVRFLEQFA
jgi:phenylalanyl-tRNA synthetase alpha chain